MRAHLQDRPSTEDARIRQASSNSERSRLFKPSVANGGTVVQIGPVPQGAFCGKCQRSFPSAEALKSHELSKHSYANKPCRMRCQFCLVSQCACRHPTVATDQAMTATKTLANELKGQELTPQGDQMCPCTICGQIFTSSSALANHLDTLAPAKVEDVRVQCLRCSPPRWFPDPRALWQHAIVVHPKGHVPQEKSSKSSSSSSSSSA